GDDLAFAGLWIDLDLADVTAGGKGEVGGIVERPLLQSRLQLLAGKFVRDIGVERDLAPGRRLVGARDREFPVLENAVAFRRLPPPQACEPRPSSPWPRSCRAPSRSRRCRPRPSASHRCPCRIAPCRYRRARR